MARRRSSAPFEDEEPISKHETGGGAKVRFIWPQLFFAALCMVFACVGFFVPAKEGPVVAYSIGAGCTLGALACLAWGVVHAGKLITRVEVYPSGLRWLRGNEWIVAAWEDIEDVFRVEVYMNGRLSNKYVEVKTIDGEDGTFHHLLRRWDRLAESVLMQTTMRKVPEAMQRFHAGETLRFGTTAIDTEGLKIDKKRYAFASMGKMEIRNGSIVVYMAGRRGEVASFSLASTPNYMVLLKLLDVSDAPKAKLG